jgi:ubiquinone/menaquinone biosynthesis C-methylase UbiE
MKIFDPLKRKKLNNPERLKWVSPVGLWELLAIDKPELLIDFGAGTGYYTNELLKFAPDATIHAYDIEPLMVQEMKEGFFSGIDRVKPQLMERDIIPLPDNCADAIWMITVFHELPNPAKTLKEIKRVLKPGGKILIVDWEKNKEACERGPALNHRIDADIVAMALTKTGFSKTKISHDFIHHYGIVAEK